MGEKMKRSGKAHAQHLELLNKFTKNSSATKQDIEKLGRKLKQGIFQRHEEAAKRKKR